MNKPLLVTDNGLAKSKIVIDVLNNLKEDGITAELYSDVVGNPTGTNVTDGADFYNKNNCLLFFSRYCLSMFPTLLIDYNGLSALGACPSLSC